MADEKTISLFDGAHMQSRFEFNEADDLKIESATKRRVAMGAKRDVRRESHTRSLRR